MTPEQRLQKAMELTEKSKQLFRDELRKSFPHLNEVEFHNLYLARLEDWRNDDRWILRFEDEVS